MAALFTHCLVARQLCSPKPIERDIYDTPSARQIDINPRSAYNNNNNNNNNTNNNNNNNNNN